MVHGVALQVWSQASEAHHRGPSVAVLHCSDRKPAGPYNISEEATSKVHIHVFSGYYTILPVPLSTKFMYNIISSVRSEGI